ncbi:pectin acetylesterase-family hydrolase [Paenibacillus sp. S150]|uniref:pectin acetylesterase-family hydrolase n=1 Tax=Paenibacillus sp. S150 TaxID=2749826 RepID=UPI001C57428C|nr:pectin acetylesterase-family hydrolase [Paenibacillus sp. S150]MBW4083013.1 hypothetical protein [Paenibacillus sp. S150]
MKRLSKFIKFAVITVLSFLILSLIAVYAFVIKRPAAVQEMADAKPYKWNKISLGPEAVSSDGSEYHLLSKKGTSRNWIIFFSGGGASWDESSAAHPIKILNFLTGREAGNYFADIPFYLLNLLDGLTATDNPENPFKDWNVAYIPYSTGDFHVGKRTAEYTKDDGSTFTMHYNGQSNVQDSLNWIYAQADKPEKLLIAGESAGGFGSAFWAGKIAEHYKDAEIYQYSDSSFLYSGKWPEIIGKEWQADFAQVFGFAPEADLIGSAYKGNGSRLPDNAVLLQSYSLYDEVLISFQNRINDQEGPLNAELIADWSRQMRGSVKSLADTLPNYYYYLTDYGLNKKTGMTGHTFATRDVFYKAEEDGIRLLDWLNDAINKNNRYSVGSRFLDES